MLIILTSAKTMTGTSKIKAPAGTMPRFAQEANEIALNMAQFSTDDLKKILKLNPKLALENYNRFQEFHTAEVHSPVFPGWQGLSGCYRSFLLRRSAVLSDADANSYTYFLLLTPAASPHIPFGKA